MTFSYLIEPLAKHHKRDVFCCGIPALDHYFQHQASQDQKKYVAAVFVMLDKVAEAIIGFYTLSSLGINAGNLPEKITKKLPKYSLLPATLLGRLAVDKNHQEKKLGELLLIDALQRSARSSKEVASTAIVVDAKDNKSVEFYKKYGFIQFSNTSDKLFLPMTSVDKLFYGE